MKCMCARFILSSEGVFGGMEFEPMLTPREKSPLPENVPRGGSNPRHHGQRAHALPTELFRPPDDDDESNDNDDGNNSDDMMMMIVRKDEDEDNNSNNSNSNDDDNNSSSINDDILLFLLIPMTVFVMLL